MCQNAQVVPADVVQFTPLSGGRTEVTTPSGNTTLDLPGDVVEGVLRERGYRVTMANEC